MALRTSSPPQLALGVIAGLSLSTTSGIDIHFWGFAAPSSLPLRLLGTGSCNGFTVFANPGLRSACSL